MRSQLIKTSPADNPITRTWEFHHMEINRKDGVLFAGSYVKAEEITGLKLAQGRAHHNAFLPDIPKELGKQHIPLTVLSVMSRQPGCTLMDEGCPPAQRGRSDCWLCAENLPRSISTW